MDRGGERKCVCCLRTGVRDLNPRAPGTCSHLFCGDCVEELFEACKSTSDAPEGVPYSVPEASRLGDDLVRERPYLVVRGAFPTDVTSGRERSRMPMREVVM